MDQRGGGFDRGQDGVFVLLWCLQRGEPRGGGRGRGREGPPGGLRMEFHVHYSVKVLVKWERGRFQTSRR